MTALKTLMTGISFGEQPRWQASAFTLAHSISTPGGVLIARYARSGQVRTGTYKERE